MFSIRKSDLTQQAEMIPAAEREHSLQAVQPSVMIRMTTYQQLHLTHGFSMRSFSTITLEHNVPLNEQMNDIPNNNKLKKNNFLLLKTHLIFIIVLLFTLFYLTQIIVP